VLFRSLFDLFNKAVDSLKLKALCEYADAMLEYDEINREFRTKSYKISRQLIYLFGLDIKAASIEDIKTCIEMIKKLKKQKLELSDLALSAKGLPMRFIYKMT
jgi:hypothetical protein